MTETRKCIDCGRALVDQVRGRPALRCGECKRGRRRIKVRPKVRCVDCLTEFDPPGHTGRPPERCESCRKEHRARAEREKTARWRKENAEYVRAYDREYQARRRLDPNYRAQRSEAEMVRKYGMTMADFEALLAKQGGVCAICEGPPNGPGKRFHVDHCHNSNAVRGLLCGRCNTAIGLLGDDPERAEKVAAYLRR